MLQHWSKALVTSFDGDDRHTLWDIGTGHLRMLHSRPGQSIMTARRSEESVLFWFWIRHRLECDLPLAGYHSANCLDDDSKDVCVPYCSSDSPVHDIQDECVCIARVDVRPGGDVRLDSHDMRGTSAGSPSPRLPFVRDVDLTRA